MWSIRGLPAKLPYDIRWKDRLVDTHTHTFRVFFWRGLPLPLPSSPGRSPTGVRLPPCDLGRSPRRDHGAYQVTWQARSPTPKENPKSDDSEGDDSEGDDFATILDKPFQFRSVQFSCSFKQELNWLAGYIRRMQTLE